MQHKKPETKREKAKGFNAARLTVIDRGRMIINLLSDITDEEYGRTRGDAILLLLEEAEPKERKRLEDFVNFLIGFNIFLLAHVGAQRFAIEVLLLLRELIKLQPSDRKTNKVIAAIWPDASLEKINRDLQQGFDWLILIKHCVISACQPFIMREGNNEKPELDDEWWQKVAPMAEGYLAIEWDEFWHKIAAYSEVADIQPKEPTNSEIKAMTDMIKSKGATVFGGVSK